ncbi:hypothetical protein ES705_37584 [subsurface metagenome]
MTPMITTAMSKSWLLFGLFSKSCPRCIRGFLLWDGLMNEAVCLNCGHRCYQLKNKRQKREKVR